ncbi:zonular occludens toxin domain-containing protein [Neisseria meningitidis]
MGTGKTSRVVSHDFEQRRRIVQNEIGRRHRGRQTALFLPYLDQDKRQFKAHELTEEQIMSLLRDVIPEGAVLIVDEAHYTYPVRAAGRPVPPYIQELTELRHHGHTVDKW